MKAKSGFTKKDAVVLIGCVLFVLANLGAIGPGGRRRAKETICLANLHQWGAAFRMYVEDNEGLLPSGFVLQLYPYYRNVELLLCPAATKKGTHPASNPGEFMGGKFKAWFALDVYFPDGIVRDVIGSYGMNGHVGEASASETSPETSWVSANVKGANRAPVLLDGAGGAVPLHWDEPPEYDGQIYVGYGPMPTGPKNINEIRNFCINRHNGGINVLFLDFSARKVGLKELWELEFMRKKWFRSRAGFPDYHPPWQFYDPFHWMCNFKNYSSY